jgi:hypothetical protein
MSDIQPTTPAKVETASTPTPQTPPVSTAPNPPFFPAPNPSPNPPVIQTEKIEATPLTTPIPGSPSQTKTAYVRPVVRTHGEAIIEYLQSHHTGQFINLTDFLKSLYPTVVGNEKPAWVHQGNMRKLQKTLMDLYANDGVVFKNPNYTRLGDNYHDGEERRRRDYNFIDLPIEAKLP